MLVSHDYPRRRDRGSYQAAAGRNPRVPCRLQFVIRLEQVLFDSGPAPDLVQGQVHQSVEIHLIQGLASGDRSEMNRIMEHPDGGSEAAGQRRSLIFSSEPREGKLKPFYPRISVNP